MKESPLQHQVSRKVFGLALSHTSKDMYQDVLRLEPETNDPREIGYTASLILESQLEQDPSFNNLVTSAAIDEALILFSAGVADTYAIQKSIYSQHDTIGFEQALAITRHPFTTHAVAKLALRDQYSLRNEIAMRDVTHAYALDETKSFVTTTDRLTTMSEPSCPFAGHEGIVMPDPLFGRFAVWAGEIAVQHYFSRSL